MRTFTFLFLSAVILHQISIGPAAGAVKLKFDVGTPLSGTNGGAPDSTYHDGDYPATYNPINWDLDLEDNDPTLAGVSGQNVANAIDFVTGLPTGISLTVTSPTGFRELGQNINGTLFPGGAASTYFDFDNLGNNIFGETTENSLFGYTSTFDTGSPRPLVEYTIAGLSSSKYYDFTFFSSRLGVSDNRETQFDVQGANSGVAFLDAANNEENISQVLQIQPTAAGTLTMTIQPGPNNNNSNNFFYLNALDITENGNAPPLGTAGDYNGNGVVDAADYTKWRDNLGAANESSINDNGDGGGVTSSDYSYWTARFGNTSGSGAGGLAGSAVPEPTFVTLWITAAAVPLVRSRSFRRK